MYERILVPTDGSEYAEMAAETAFELARALEANVDAICVAEVGPIGSVRLPRDEASAEEVLSGRAETFVTRLAEQGDDYGLSVTTEVRQGVPVHEIIEYADEIDADLIVMGTRGRGGVNRMLLGSVTDGVTRYGDVDVLAVRHDGQPLDDEPM